MDEDIFDVVDAEDAVVGRAPRSVVHARGLMHRSAHILVFSADGGKILLQLRSAQKDLYPLRYTTSVSGHVDSGESYVQAALREMREEIGVAAGEEDLRFVGKIPPSARTGWEFTAVYEFRCPMDTQFKPQPSEVERLEWRGVGQFERDIAEMPQKFTPSFLEAYALFAKEGGRAV